MLCETKQIDSKENKETVAAMAQTKSFQLSEIKNVIADLQKQVHDLQQQNEQRLKSIETKQTVDPITVGQMTKLQEQIESLEKKWEQICLDSERPYLSSEDGKMQTEQDAETKAVSHYIRTGESRGLSACEGKMMQAGNDMDGGFFVGKSLVMKMIKRLEELSPMRQICNVMTISSSSVEYLYDAENAGGGWVNEIDERSETETPHIRKRQIAVNEMYAQPKVTQKLIDDSEIDISSWLADKIAEQFSLLENRAFISSLGGLRPRGILSYAAGNNWNQIERVNTGSDSSITSDGLIMMQFALKSQYQNNARFIMNRSVARDIRLLKDEHGQYVWQPSLIVGTPATLLGAPVTYVDVMPSLEKDAEIVAYGDFKQAYHIIDRTDVRFLRDPYTEKPFVKFYTTKRVGGDVANFDAVKVLKVAS